MPKTLTFFPEINQRQTPFVTGYRRVEMRAYVALNHEVGTQLRCEFGHIWTIKKWPSPPFFQWARPGENGGEISVPYVVGDLVKRKMTDANGDSEYTVASTDPSRVEEAGILKEWGEKGSPGMVSLPPGVALHNYHPLTGPTVEDIRRVGEDIIDLLVRKNQNYGSSVFKAPKLAPHMDPDSAIRVRLSDKLARIETLLKGEEDKVGEAVDDTIRDAIGYLILWLVWREWQETSKDAASVSVEYRPTSSVPGPQSPREQQRPLGAQDDAS